MSDYTRNWAGQAEIDYVVLSSGDRLRVLKAGTGPALFLMHTLRTQLDYFQRVIPLLTSQYTVYAVDLPGLGWSAIRPGARYEEPAIRHAILETIQKLGLRDVTLAGESMGATLSLTAGAELGSLVRRVIALNTYDYPQGVERGNLLASMVVKAMRIPGLGLLPAKLENATILGGILAGGFANPQKLPRDFVEELIRSGKRPGYPKVAIAYFRALGSFVAARHLYQRIKVPVTLVYGHKDWSNLVDRQSVSDQVPRSRLISLKDTGHFAPLENPEEIASVFIDALSEP